MACVLAAALFAFGQGTFAAKREVYADEVAFLRQQPEEITLKYSGLGQQLANADSARLDAELAASVSEEARVELAAKHVDVELDLTMAHHQATSATVSLLGMASSRLNAPVGVGPVSSGERNGVSDWFMVFEQLRQAHLAFGASINPIYRPDSSVKREANSLIQQTLRTLGAFDGPIQGNGLATVQALKSYQISHALPVTGIVAERTMAAMEKDFEGLSPIAMGPEDFGEQPMHSRRPVVIGLDLAQTVS